MSHAGPGAIIEREMDNVKSIIIVLAAAMILSVSARGQGFLNLDFESAFGLPGNPGNGEIFSAMNALPDWTVSSAPYVYYASNIIYGTAESVGLNGGSLALSGNFSAELFVGGSISQTGLVPDDAESLEFEAKGPGASLLSITLGGQILSYSLLSEGPTYNVYGVNIPTVMVGQTEALTFANQQLGVGVLLDNIEFSPMGVPEPSEWALIGFGAVMVSVRYRHKRARPTNL
jgi:hypothetical protein